MKKRILIPEELKESPMGSFFQENKFELDSIYEKSFHSEYCFIVNDYCPEILSIPRLKLDSSITYDEKIEKQVRALITQKDMNDPNVDSLLKSFFTNDNFELIEHYCDTFKEVTSIKIHEYLNVGYFIDTIVVEAYKNGFDYDSIRSYLNQIFEYAFWKIEGRKVNPVLDVLYSFSNNVFAVEVSCQTLDFKIEENFYNKNQFIASILEKTNYFHVNYFTKRDKLSLSSAWFKNSSLKKFKSYFLSETSHKNNSTVCDVPMVLGIEEKEQVLYSPRVVDEESVQARKLSLSRKFALFIKNYRKNETDPKELMSLELADVDEYLKNYPRQEAVADIDEEVRRFILKLLQDEKLYNGITEYMNKIASSNLDPQMEHIQRILSGKSLDDLDEIIRIKGVTDKMNEETTLVKGWFDESADGDNFRIKGVTDSIGNNEKWAVKRSEISEKIQEEITRIKSEGRNVLQEDIIRVVSKEINSDDANVAIIIKDIVEEALSAELTQASKLEEAFPLKFMSGQAAPEDSSLKAKTENHLMRMKKIIEQMRTEMLRMKQENEDLKMEGKLQVLSDPGANEIIDLKRALSNVIELNKNKDKMALKAKSDFEQILKSKDEKLQILEDRIEQMKAEYAKSSEHANEEKLEELKSENKNLTLKLKLANRKVDIINENMDKQDSDANAKKDKEIQTLKASIQMAQSFIENYKQEKIELENKLISEQEKLISLRDQKSSKGSDEVNAEKDVAFASLSAEKKALEDKFRVQIIESKKMEQKLKFTTAQLEDLQKKKSAATSNTTKGNDIYIKQLELANSRLADAANDLNDKKKELHKLKQENGLLNTKLAELERKLNIADKKAS